MKRGDDREILRGAEALSVGLLGCAEIVPVLFRRGNQALAVTDQTSAHDPVTAICRWLDISMGEKRAKTPRRSKRREALHAQHVRRC